jgi:hypothetical protein
MLKLEIEEKGGFLIEKDKLIKLKELENMKNGEELILASRALERE